MWVSQSRRIVLKSVAAHKGVNVEDILNTLSAGLFRPICSPGPFDSALRASPIVCACALATGHNLLILELLCLDTRDDTISILKE